MNIAHCVNYRGHVVYDDGRLYQNHELIGQYATPAAAKAAATRRQKRQNAEHATEHHKRIGAIWGRA